MYGNKVSTWRDCSFIGGPPARPLGASSDGASLLLFPQVRVAHASRVIVWWMLNPRTPMLSFQPSRLGANATCSMDSCSFSREETASSLRHYFRVVGDGWGVSPNHDSAAWPI